MSFYLAKDTFGTVTISLVFVCEIETVSTTRFFQRGSIVDEKHGVVGILFLAEFAEKYLRESVCSRRFKLCME
ncbi:hypothetical protein C475_08091 [Halosimplex carlsbadense 2-9-1]|uniref:Uncharacterized protein n=1 Tax=Halosimplex carlsbadense 2-9-1 TaxID=797114 RepID=M0CYB2_9EURY|nr:hypothetical protein C475_08091 [Halosimplex carlsbadense 2-9-1]